jgi:putative flippase GtrA
LSLIKKIWEKRVVKFALIGLIGIPINLVALKFFLTVFALTGLRDNWLNVVAQVCSFEVGTIINFVLNQLITYRDQMPTTFNAWVVKSIKAQVANMSAFLVATLISLFFSVVVHIDPYVANTLGIIINFVYKFLVSDRFVFRVKPVEAIEDATAVVSSEEMPSHCQTTPNS